MTDITTVWAPQNSAGDWLLAGAALESGNDLQTSVLISLFSDRQASADDVIPDSTGNRRGWWGDLGATIPIGSRLWLLSREKLTQSVANRAKTYITEALQWLITDGVAAQINVSTMIIAPTMLGAVIQIVRSTGVTVTLNFAWAWQGVS